MTAPARLEPYTWPQDSLRIPNALQRFTPPLDRANIDLARQESFTMSGTFTYTNPAAGAVQELIIPTDQDGDFWCDQIALVGWSTSQAQMGTPHPATLQIQDVRTGRRLCYPDAGIPINYLMTLQLGPGDTGIVIGNSPPPAGFRSTATIPQPFCFTRQGGIKLTLQFLAAVPGAFTRTIDIGFSGWKEYAYAAQDPAAR